MPVLNPSGHVGTVAALLVNATGDTLESEPLDSVDVGWDGFAGDVHSGVNRVSCSRVTRQYPKGTEIRNTRQISALGEEELGEIADALDLDAVAPAWVGANLLVRGLPAFSRLPPSSRLIAANGTALVVDMENAPCRFPGEIIERHRPGHGKDFPKAALGRRGVTLWVERPGSLRLGDELVLHVPPPVRWP